DVPRGHRGPMRTRRSQCDIIYKNTLDLAEQLCLADSCSVHAGLCVHYVVYESQCSAVLVVTLRQQVKKLIPTSLGLLRTTTEPTPTRTGIIPASDVNTAKLFQN
ncbi:unnamed protein product, partial [Pleuronectes platessa]